MWIKRKHQYGQKGINWGEAFGHFSAWKRPLLGQQRWGDPLQKTIREEHARRKFLEMAAQ